MLLKSFIKKIIRFMRRIFLFSDGTQSGELRAIKKFLPKDSNPYFVDIGAHDGISLSNSLYFANIGWKGLLFEPMPKPFLSLSENYKDNNNVKCVNIACSNKKGIADFYIGASGEDGMLGTLCLDKNEWFKKARSEKKIKVNVDTITNQLLENNFPKKFTLLLIDTKVWIMKFCLDWILNSFNRI